MVNRLLTVLSMRIFFSFSSNRSVSLRVEGSVSILVDVSLTCLLMLIWMWKCCFVFRRVHKVVVKFHLTLHTAQLHSGEAVAVKVQRPGVPEQLALDAHLLRLLGGQLQRFAGTRGDLVAVVDEMVSTTCFVISLLSALAICCEENTGHRGHDKGAGQMEGDVPTSLTFIYVATPWPRLT